MKIPFEVAFSTIGAGFLIIAFFCLAGLFHQLKVEARTLKIGILAGSFLVSLFLALQVFFFLTRIRTFAIRSEIILFSLIFAIFPFVFAWYILYQLIKVWRQETHSLANLLLTLAVIGYLVLLILVNVLNRRLPLWGRRLLIFVPLSTIYLTFTFVNFFLSSYLYGLKMHFQKHFSNVLVTLGAGLVKGDQVGKLLAGRITTTIEFTHRLSHYTQKKPVIIFSGGQGGSETTTEAEAMQNYALKQKHWPLAQSRLEKRSHNTRENLMFSAKLLAQETQEQAFTFCTSDYHVFRAALLARSLGINANGIGSKTPIYYRGTAFLREYIAILVMNKKRHLLVAGAIIVFSLISAISTLFH